MANILHGISFDRASTTSSRKSQGPFLNKLKSGLVKFINRRRHSSIVDTFRPTKHQYVPARQHSFSDEENHNQYDDDDDSEDDLDNISDSRIKNGALQHNIYSKDDDVERIRYNKTTCYPHHHQQQKSTVSILSPSLPPTILVKRSSSSNHRHTNHLQNSSSLSSSSSSSHHYQTNSLQNSSIISTSGSINNGKPMHYHYSRHYSHISFMSTSNMTVNSGDLTAKEFADMAGIRIIPDNNDDMDDARGGGGDQPYDMATTTTNSITMATSSSLAPSGHQQRSSQTSEENNWSMVSSRSQQSQQSVSTSAAAATTTTKIWDNEFWRQPCKENHHPSTMTFTKKTASQQPTLKNQRSAILQHRQTLSLPSATSTIPCQHTKSQSNCDFPIIHELRRIRSSTLNNNNQQHNNNNTLGDTCVIRKGRFEIQLKP